jgi:hypothetical protein
VTDLQQGSHAITLRAADSDGQSGTATVTVHVGVAPTNLYLPILIKRSP